MTMPVSSIRHACAWLLLMPLAAAAQTPVDRRAPASPDGAVRIQNMTGSVRVIGWDVDTIAVTGTLPPAALGQFVFGVGEGGAKLGVWETGSKPAAAELEVRVPARSTVWIKTSGADVRVTGVTGGVDVYAVSGDVVIEGTPREVLAESLAGDVTITADTRSVRAKTATGAVTLRGAITDATATSVSGALSIAGDGVARGRFESIDGDIVWRGDIDARSTLDFVSHAGVVRFELPPDAAAEIVISTYQGRIDNRIGAQAERTGSALDGTEHRLRVGAPPGGQVTVRTFKGDIILQQTR